MNTCKYLDEAQRYLRNQIRKVTLYDSIYVTFCKRQDYRISGCQRIGLGNELIMGGGYCRPVSES